MRRLTCAAFLAALLLSACGGGSGGEETTNTPDAKQGEDAQLPDDAASLPDGTTVEDQGEVPPPDEVSPPDPDLPVPTGDKQLGEECMQDGECQSGLCWATSGGSGCTAACNSHLECQVYGLVCVPIRASVNGCVPPPPVQLPCEGHETCTYPTTCIDQYGWCDLPECTFDGDCPVGQECEEGTRECQPKECQSTYECASPVEFCFDGTCGPPECTQKSDCPQGQICSYQQGICDDALPCNEEGACNWYNQVCVDGLCEPNLCTVPCGNAAHICNPKTGKCGPPCSGPGQCPAGFGCDVAAGACYENLPPVAVAATPAPAGGSVTLDGTGSFDPEGSPVSYRWMLLSVPPGATQQTGTIFCQQPTCTVSPLAKGLYQVGLWVQDEPGMWSPQTVAPDFVK